MSQRHKKYILNTEVTPERKKGAMGRNNGNLLHHLWFGRKKVRGAFPPFLLTIFVPELSFYVTVKCKQHPPLFICNFIALIPDYGGN